MSNRANAAKKWLPVLGGAILLPAVVVLYQGRPVDAVKEYGLGTPGVPSPNAHPLYEEAARAIKQEPVDEALDYNIGSVGFVPHPYPLAAKEKWLRDNQRGFELFEQAQKAEYYFPPVRTPQDGGRIDPPFGFRALAKYKLVESRVHGEKGRPVQAVDSALDIWEFGIRTGQGAPLIPALNALASEVYARQALQDEIAHLNGPQAAQAAQRLEGVLAKRFPYEDMLREERAATLVQQKAAYDKAVFDAKQQAENDAKIARGDYNISYSSEPAPAQGGPWVNFVVRRMMSQYAGGMDTLIANANVAWSQRSAPPQTSGPNDKTDKLIAVTDKSRFMFVRTDTSGQLSLGRLALHAFRKDTGAYPRKLDQLVPKYLKTAPRDPFSNGDILRYRQEGKRYKLWSVGPDSRDDGGRAIENPNSPRPSSRYLVNVGSSGDMVANVNDRVITRTADSKASS